MPCCTCGDGLLRLLRADCRADTPAQKGPPVALGLGSAKAADAGHWSLAGDTGGPPDASEAQTSAMASAGSGGCPVVQTVEMASAGSGGCPVVASALVEVPRVGGSSPAPWVADWGDSEQARQHVQLEWPWAGFQDDLQAQVPCCDGEELLEKENTLVEERTLALETPVDSSVVACAFDAAQKGDAADESALVRESTLLEVFTPPRVASPLLRSPQVQSPLGYPCSAGVGEAPTWAQAEDALRTEESEPALSEERTMLQVVPPQRLSQGPDEEGLEQEGTMLLIYPAGGDRADVSNRLLVSSQGLEAQPAEVELQGDASHVTPRGILCLPICKCECASDFFRPKHPEVQILEGLSYEPPSARGSANNAAPAC